MYSISIISAVVYNSFILQERLYHLKCTVDYVNRGGIKTEEKAKVVAAVWGTYLIQLLAELDIFHQPDDFGEKDE